MGQYYRILNLDKKEYLSSYDYDCGAKMMESAYIATNLKTNGYMSALSYLIDNQWKGDRVIMLGDYATLDWAENTPTQIDAQFLANLKDEFPFIQEKDEDGYLINLIDCDEHGFIKSNIKSNKKVKRYLCNNATKQYIDLNNLPIDYTYKDNDGTTKYGHIYPLPILISVGNGLGLGDYSSNNDELAGTWANTSDSIFFGTSKPKDFEEFKPDFTEYEKVLRIKDYEAKQNNQTLTASDLVELFYKHYTRLTNSSVQDFYNQLAKDKTMKDTLNHLKISTKADLLDLLLNQ